jgi:adenylosuccinate lyase
VLERAESLRQVLLKKAFLYKDLLVIGRTHGIHAEPITFGVKFLIWHDEMERNLKRLRAARETISVGKISGSVGTYIHFPPAAEESALKKLDLLPARVSSQVIQRDRHAFYLSTLAVAAASLEKMALEIRGLQRTEVREVEEYFSPEQKGSSAMPHKRNPITAEQICGLARVVRANAHAALENVALWHERDISHSSVERVILADSTILLDYLLAKTATLVETMFVYPDRMRENLDLLKGLIFSGQLLLDLVEKGALREEAYRWVQRNAMQVWETHEDYRTLVERDDDIRQYLKPSEIAEVFNVERYLTHVDEIFASVFGK